MKHFTPMQYLAIDIANTYGLDKLTYEKRIEWVRSNIDNLESYTDKAEEPMLYYKAVKALRDSQAGKPTGHTVALDSVCSGLQLMSVLMRCEKGANITGLVNPNKRSDAYTEVTAYMNKLLKKDDLSGIQITRKEAKEATMTALYGSIAVPKRVFGEDLLPYFYKALSYKAKGAMHLLQLLKAAWDENALVHQWTLPDGYLAYVPVMETVETRVNVVELNYSARCNLSINNTQEKGISLIANTVHSIDAYVLRSLVRRCNYNPIEINHFIAISSKVLFVDSNESLTGVQEFINTGLADISFIKYINSNNISQYPLDMIKELRRICKTMLTHKPFEVITIHDSFACSAVNCNQLRFHYNEILADMSESTMIDDILNQLYWDEITVKKGKSISDKIRQSNYGIC